MAVMTQTSNTAQPSRIAHTTRINPYVVQTHVVPIILVPGVMGTRLNIPETKHQWDPDSYSNALGWATTWASHQREWMHARHPAEIMQDGSLTPQEKKRGYGGVVRSSYVDFLRIAQGWRYPATLRVPVHALGYDWRQSNRASGTTFAQDVERVLQAEGASKCILVTHSMGGYVARAALKQSPDLASKVLGVVHVVQPVRGAAVLYRRFFTGVLAEEDGGGGIFGTVFSHLLGSTSDSFTTVISGMPGPIELLPNNAYRDTKGQAWLRYLEGGVSKTWSGDVYSLYRSPHSPPALMWSDPPGAKEPYPFGVQRPDGMYLPGRDVAQDVLNAVEGAQQFHAWLGEFKHENTFSIYSTGRMTDTAVQFDSITPPAPVEEIVPIPNDVPMKIRKINWKYRGLHMQRALEGDGTVPMSSGSALFPGQRFRPGQPVNEHTRQFEVHGVEHGDAFNSGDVQNLLHRLVRQILHSKLKVRLD